MIFARMSPHLLVRLNNVVKVCAGLIHGPLPEDLTAQAEDDSDHADEAEGLELGDIVELDGKLEPAGHSCHMVLGAVVDDKGVC